MRPLRYCQPCASYIDIGEQWSPVGEKECDHCGKVTDCFERAPKPPEVMVQAYDLARLVVKAHEIDDCPAEVIALEQEILDKAREILREGGE